MPPEPSKPCKKCGRDQVLTAFYVDRARPDGRRNSCIACDQVRKRTPEVRAQGKKYNESEKGKAAYERYRASGRKYEVVRTYQERPEVIAKRKARSKGYSRHHWHHGKGKATYQAKAQTPEFRAWKRDYEKKRQARPEVRAKLLPWKRRYEQGRWAKKKSLPATFTVEDWERCLRYFNASCAYCGIGNVPLHQEHAIPLILGGPYAPENIVPACISCNSSKRSKRWDDWATPEARDRISTYFASLGQLKLL